MSYDYKTQRPELFTEENQAAFLNLRDRAHKLLAEAGAFRMQEVGRGSGFGSNWTELAAVDRLVELGEIVELLYPNGRPCGQYRVFVSAKGSA